MHLRQEDSVRLIEEILQKQRLQLSLSSFQIEEQMGEEPGRVLAIVKRMPEEESLTIEGAGVGAFDAFFVALKERFLSDFPSLKKISFAGIKLRSVPDSDREHPTDAEAEVTLRFQNIRQQDYYFQGRSRSMLRANMECILRVVEFFANSEKACQLLEQQIEDVQDASRQETLREQLSTLQKHILDD